MHRFLFFSLALVCLLAGCSAPQASDPAPDESNDLDAYPLTIGRPPVRNTK